MLKNSSSNPQTLKISNSFVWNTTRLDHIGGTGNIEIKYTDMQLLNPDENITYTNTGNLNKDPKFVGSNDFHLMTTGKSEFVPPSHKAECSPCIDAGDEDANSIEPDNSRVNMGRYGNTNEAAGSCIRAGKLKNSTPLISKSGHLEISPNPFSDLLSISYIDSYSGQTDISIHNLRGQTVFHNQLNSTANHPISIQWNGQDQNGKKLEPGVYLIRISTAESSVIEKVILSK